MANKMYTYCILIVGLMILFNLAGLSVTGSWVIDSLGLGSPNGVADLASSNMGAKIITLLVTLGSAAAIYIGIYGRSISTVPFSAVLGAFFFSVMIGDLAGIVVLASSRAAWLGTIIFLIVAPISVGFFITLWDWVRSGGSD